MVFGVDSGFPNTSWHFYFYCNCNFYYYYNFFFITLCHITWCVASCANPLLLLSIGVKSESGETPKKQLSSKPTQSKKVWTTFSPFNIIYMTFTCMVLQLSVQMFYPMLSTLSNPCRGRATFRNEIDSFNFKKKKYDSIICKEVGLEFSHEKKNWFSFRLPQPPNLPPPYIYYLDLILCLYNKIRSNYKSLMSHSNPPTPPCPYKNTTWLQRDWISLSYSKIP